LDFFKRFTSFSIALLFLFSTLFGTAPAVTFAEIQEPVNIEIPSELGSIDRAFQGESKFPVIYIQDAHASLEAQENIAQLINTLVEKQGYQTVYVEGYEGELRY